MSKPTFISLFAGVGGLDSGFEKAGWECVANVELDKNAAGVLKYKRPHIPIFTDITKVEPDDLPDADAILYGFPCQDVSVAGHRKGMNEETRTGLFYHAARLIHGKRNKGLRFALAENVFGLLSADDSLALPRVVRELTDIGSNAVGWTVLDSQHVGWSSAGKRQKAVPQRRRRIFILSTFGDIGGESIAEIFALSERVSGNIRKNGKERKAREATTNATKSSGVDVYNGLETGETTATLTTATGMSTGSGPKIMGVDFYNNSLNDETSQTLSAAAADKNHTGGVLEIRNDQAISLQGNMIGRDHKNGPQGDGVNEDICFTLTSADQHGVVHPIQKIAFEPRSQDGIPRVTGDPNECVSPTLNTMSGGQRQPAIAWSQRGRNGKTMIEDEKDEVSPALRTAPQSQMGVCSLISDTTPKGKEDVSMALRATKEMLVGTPEFAIRRLTPIECERLQGFEDNHTEFRYKMTCIDNKWEIQTIDDEPVVEKQADGPRYKQMGNAVSVTTAQWIAEGMIKHT
jgi:DNA (cytosine-5)-methyltransferase 1